MFRRVFLVILSALISVAGIFVFIPPSEASASDPATPVSDAAGFLGMDIGGSYYLTCDIALNAGWDGDSGSAFKGSLNGNGHTVTLSGTPMFKTFSGTLKDIRLEGFVGSAENIYQGDAGPAAAIVTGNASFINVSSFAYITSSGNAGGVAGSCISDYANVTFDNCIFNGSASGGGYSGGIAGYSGGEASVRFLGCTLSGNVTGLNGAGGILGCGGGLGVYASGCINTGSISSITGFAGGIVGSGGENVIYIKDCTNGSLSPGNAGSVNTGGNQAGGIFAYHPGGYTFIENCVNYADISTSTVYSGGIAGQCCGSTYISYCYNYGGINSTSSASYTGGIVGYLLVPLNSLSSYNFSSIIEYCCNYGNVSSSDSLPSRCGTGGIAGYIAGIPDSYLTGNLNCGNITSAGGRAGGICAYNLSDSLSVTYNCNSGTVTSGASSGAVCQIISSGLPTTGTDMNFYLSGGSPAVLFIDNAGTLCSINPDGYSFTSEELSGGGLASRLNSAAAGGSPTSAASDMASYYGILYQNLGTDARPSTDRTRGAVYFNTVFTNNASAGFNPNLTAGTASEFAAAASAIASSAKFTGQLTITADIDLSAQPSLIIECFSGVLEGSGHTIKVGGPIFGQLSGRVQNLNLTGSTGSVAGLYGTGALATSAAGFTEVSNVTSAATVSAGLTGAAGGLVGLIKNGHTTFTDCAFSGSVIGLDYAGGIAGECSAAYISFDDCKNSGAINARYAGGIFGGVNQNNYGVLTFLTCINTGGVCASDYAGGIAGYTAGTLIIDGSSCGTDTVNAVTVSSSGSAGGIAGYVGGYSDDADTLHRVISGCSNSAYVTAASGYAAGIAAYIPAVSAIISSVNSGNVGLLETGSVNAGGIAGYLNCFPSKIDNCSNSGSVTATKYCAGIVASLLAGTGVSYQCDISYCFNDGVINGTGTSSYSGGIAAICDGGNVYFSYCGNRANVTAAGSMAGGILGYIKSTLLTDISYCFSAGARLSATTYASGIVGYCKTEKVRVLGCYICGTYQCTSGTDKSCAILWNNTYKSTGISENYYCSDIAAKYIICQQGSEDINVESYAFLYSDLTSGSLTARMNTSAGKDLFFQNLVGTEADKYPTTEEGHEKVIQISETAAGELGYGNSSCSPKPEILPGASVRLSSSSGIRFTSYITAESIEKACLLSDAGNEPSYGTLIVPTDYLTDYKVNKFTVSGLSAKGIDEYNFDNPTLNVNKNGLYYINIKAENGIVTNPDGSININAALVNLKTSSFSRYFSAVSYIRYKSLGTDYYIFSDFDLSDNSRSMELVASRALADVSPTQNTAQGYVNQLDDGTWSLYSNDARDMLDDYLTEYSVTLRSELCFSVTMHSGLLSDRVKYGSLLVFSVSSTESGVVPKVYINSVLISPDSNGKYRITVSGDISILIQKT